MTDFDKRDAEIETNYCVASLIAIVETAQDVKIVERIMAAAPALKKRADDRWKEMRDNPTRFTKPIAPVT